MPNVNEDPEILPDQRDIDRTAKRYEDVLQDVVGRLNQIGREVAREGKPRVMAVGSDGELDYQHAVERVVHTVTWGLANLNLSTLMDAATDAHATVRGRWR